MSMQILILFRVFKKTFTLFTKIFFAIMQQQASIVYYVKKNMNLFETLQVVLNGIPFFLAFSLRLSCSFPLFPIVALA